MNVRQRTFLTLYVPLWATWFRWGRGILSRTVNRFRGRLAGPNRYFESLDAFRAWWQNHTRWKSDPLQGIIDIVASLEHAQWQWAHKGIFEDDCDGLAFVAAHYLADFADDHQCHVVTLLLNPFEYPTLWEGLQLGAHVLCLFQHQGRWHVLSNTEIFDETWSTFEEALYQNPYSAGHTILWYRVDTVRRGKHNGHLPRISKVNHVMEG
ncbi:MAG: hypothetical protein GXO55_10825 [Chloroflexi bacterium]|nr:hypothetical protein [Chloroflexota bacterium]